VDLVLGNEAAADRQPEAAKAVQSPERTAALNRSTTASTT
jgi:hypothetical protein